MKKNTINKEYALQMLKENYDNYHRNGDPDDMTTLRDYAESQADSDPGFFRWLFNNDDIEDFGENLTEEQKEEYQEFFDECGEEWDETFQPLMESDAMNIIGGKIEWTAEGYNRRYGGKCIVRDVDFTKEHPLDVETIEGDDLSSAYLEYFGPLCFDNGKWVPFKGERSFVYSDDFREISYRIVD